MKIIFVLFLCICNSLSGLMVETTSGRAYVPEPVLMIHGFNADAGSWKNLVTQSSVRELYENYSVYENQGITARYYVEVEATVTPTPDINGYIPPVYQSEQYVFPGYFSVLNYGDLNSADAVNDLEHQYGILHTTFEDGVKLV